MQISWWDFLARNHKPCWSLYIVLPYYMINSFSIRVSYFNWKKLTKNQYPSPSLLSTKENISWYSISFLYFYSMFSTLKLWNHNNAKVIMWSMMMSFSIVIFLVHQSLFWPQKWKTLHLLHFLCNKWQGVCIVCR